MIKQTSPHFVGIGMAKSGTTWLYSVLHQHPEIWMPPVKEIHFFDDYFWFVLAGDRSRYFSMNPYSKRRWRRYLTSETKRVARFPSISAAIWTFRFLCAKRDYQWYSSLFPKYAGLVCGEITPEYAVLDRDHIKAIREQYPFLKVLLLLRNPVERAWSHAKMELAFRRGRSVDEISVEELTSFFQDEGVKRRGMYSRILREWSDEFGPEQFFVGLYDEIGNNPELLIKEVYGFLGVNDKWAPSDKELRRVVFKGLTGDLQTPLRVKLREECADDIHAVSEFLGIKELGNNWK